MNIDETILDQVQSLADDAEPVDLSSRGDGDDAGYVPFPTEVLPNPVRDFIQAAAQTLCCDECYVALPLIASLAAAVGNTRRIQLKPGWEEPCIFWTVIIDESGTMKSPAWHKAIEFLEERQKEAFLDYDDEIEAYKVNMKVYERDYRKWQRPGQGNSADAGQPPPEPQKPKPWRILCSDATVEAVADRFQDSPRGLLLSRDELSGWLSSFDAYKATRGADVSHYLSMHRAGSITVDRKTGDRRVIYVPMAGLSITGSVQPVILKKALGGRGRHDELDGKAENAPDKAEHFANGLAARLLMAYPPRIAKHWTDESIPDEVDQRMRELFDGLLKLEFAGDGGPVIQFDDEKTKTASKPVDLALSPDAKKVFVEFYNKHAEEQVNLPGDLAAAWSKLEGYAARFALLIHLIRCSTKDTSIQESNVVDKDSMEAGITLTRWFGDEAVRIYAAIGGDGDSKGNRKKREMVRLLQLIRKNDGSMTTRDLQRSSRKYRTSHEAERALQALVDQGLGDWKNDDHDGNPGRPVRRFHLRGRADVDRNGENPGKTANSVDVDSAPESGSTDIGSDRASRLLDGNGANPGEKANRFDGDLSDEENGRSSEETVDKRKGASPAG